MNSPSKVKFLSRELVCLHEAGHVVTALNVGATVKGVELFLDPDPHARTSILRDPRQARLISCSGFAVEWHLYEQKRLLNSLGELANDDEALAEALQNASLDMVSFADARAALGNPCANIQDEFIGTALAEVLPTLEFEKVERFAKALNVEGKLSERRIKELASPGPKSWIGRIRKCFDR